MLLKGLWRIRGKKKLNKKQLCVYVYTQSKNDKEN